jgi:hypothetical protein
MGAAAIAARDERCMRIGDALQPRDDVIARSARRVRTRADDDEIVVHDAPPADPMAFGDECLLGRLIVHEYHVGIATAPDVERLAGAGGHDANLDAGRPAEGGQDVPEQPRLLGRRGRCDGDELLRMCRRAAGGEQQPER